MMKSYEKTVVVVGLVGLGFLASSLENRAIAGIRADETPLWPSKPSCPPLRPTALGAPFVPNHGQWPSSVRFMRQGRSSSLCISELGWCAEYVRSKSGQSGDAQNTDHPDIVAVRFEFESGCRSAQIVGENRRAGWHNYFFGNDPAAWCTNVPLYNSVLYRSIYEGTDLRVRDVGGVPEYDLLLQPGADLSRVIVRVSGAKHLSITPTGELQIHTALGCLTQPVPMTWQSDSEGAHLIPCRFKLLGPDRYCFVADAWKSDSSLVIDPAMIWSTYLGGNGIDSTETVSVNSRGATFTAGRVLRSNFPTTTGAYGRVAPGSYDVFVASLNPSLAGASQLIYSTFLGGTGSESARAISVSNQGVITIVGSTNSADWPTTSGAFDSAANGLDDVCLAQIDPNKIGKAQLIYSTYLGGPGMDLGNAVFVSKTGSVTLAGGAYSGFPITANSYDGSHNGGLDAFVTQLDLTKAGAAQLTYSTFLGGRGQEAIITASVIASGSIYVVGTTGSTDFPVTLRAFDTSHNSPSTTDVFLTVVDPSQLGTGQLAYSTFLGGEGYDAVNDTVVVGNTVTIVGSTRSSKFPLSSNAYDSVYSSGEAFVSQILALPLGRAGLVYSSFLGGKGADGATGVTVNSKNVFTIAGVTSSPDFPTSGNALDRSFNGILDGFVARLDPASSTQLVYSTFLGGRGADFLNALCVTESGTAVVAGITYSADYPTTAGAYSRSYSGGMSPLSGDVCVTMLSMGVKLYGNVHEVPISPGGRQVLTMDFGVAHAGRTYWVFGSMSGTRPGTRLLGPHIPLNIDAYTGFAILHSNSTGLSGFKGILGRDGTSVATINVPPGLPVVSGIQFNHACVVWDSSFNISAVSNAVPIVLR